MATIAVATIRDARLTLLGFFTIFLRRDYSLHLRIKLEDTRFGMTDQPHPGHFQSVAHERHKTRRFDLVIVRYKGLRIGSENVIAEVDDGASGQIRARHMIPVQ